MIERNWNMKDISMKRILRYTIATFLVMILTAYGFGVGIASAESGNITLTQNIDKSYTTGASAAFYPSYGFTKIFVDSGDYNQITQIFFNTSGTGTTYATNGKSTNFVITSCGSGGGVASYSKSATAMAWYFTNPSTVTCSPLVVSYTTNIFSTDLSHIDSCSICGSAVDVNRPVMIFGNDNDNAFTGSWLVTVNFVVTNHYSISYPSGGSSQLFETNITKVGYATTNTKVLIQNISGSPITYPVQGDNTFNNANFDVVNTFKNGIALNMSVSGGLYTIQNINLTNSGLPTPSPTPVIDPITGGGIVWDKTVYTPQSLATLTFLANQCIFCSFKITIYKDGVANKGYESVGYTGSVVYLIPDVGVYRADYIKVPTICIFCSNPDGDVIGTATVTVNTSITTLSTVATAVDGSTIPLLIKFGYNISSAFIQDDRISTGFGVTTSFNLSCPCNTTAFVQNYIIRGTYKHQLRLFDENTKNMLDSAIVDVTSGSITPINKITNNLLIVDDVSLHINDILTGYYEISDSNYSNYSTFLIKLGNPNVTFKTISLTSQKGIFSIPLNVNNLDYIQTGLATVNLTGRNGISNFVDTVLVSVPVTITGGIMTVSPGTACKGDIINIKWRNAVSGSILKINYAVGGIPKIDSYTISGNNSIQFSVPTTISSDISVQLYDSNNILIETYLVKFTCGTPVPTPTVSPDRGKGGILTIFDGWVSLLGFGVSPLSKFFFAWIITTIFIVGGFATGRGMAAGTLLGAGSWGWFMAIGYLPQWFLIVVVLQLVLASRWFR